jgi:type II secretory pathway component PulF
MPFFKYQIINKDYDKEVGSLEAADMKQVETILAGRGVQIISISQSLSLNQFKDYLYGAFSHVGTRDLVLFFRQFAVLVSASINLSESLRILAEQTEGYVFKKIIGDISQEVDSGDRLSDSMGKHKTVFSEFHISVIRAGESSGKLDDALGYLADEEERNFSIIKKVKGALTYPALVMSALVIVGVLMMLFVVPKLVSIFNEVGGELPIMTRVLIATSNFFVNYWWLLLAAAIGFILLLRFYLKLPFGKRQFDYLVLRLPIAGDLVKKISIVRFTRSLSTLLMGGITISNSLRIAKGIVGNTLYKDLINDTIIEVEKGNSISSVFVKSWAVPVMMPKMMIVGEKTGKLDFVLQKIAEFYDKEVQNKLDNLMVLLEPAIVILMGAAVGVMAAAIILPMYNLTSQF